ncbi:MAG: hypothetical protein IJM34_03505 [Lachnospiraceae bacterium]|nr:hypothetical protein [Lachnospiraceae bacterium]
MKKAVRITAFIAICFVWLSGVYEVLRWKDTQGDYISSVTELKNTPDDTVDVVFVGSSHVYAGIYPSYLWSDWGISAFNLSISGMDRDSAYYYMKHMFKTQSPKVAVVDMFALSFDTHLMAGNVYRNYISLPLSKDTLPQLKAYAAKDKSVSANIYDYVARWPIIHTRYRELTRYDFELDAPNYFARGEYPNWECQPTWLYRPDEASPKIFESDQEKWLDDLVSLCKENNCELVFMSLPFRSYEDEQNYIDHAVIYADEHGIPMFDFNRMTDELQIDPQTDFFDETHVNALGAKKLSRFMAQWLDDTYDMPDHRGDAAYEVWDKDLKYYEHRRDGDAMASSQDMYEFLPMMLRLDDTVAVIHLSGEYESEKYEVLTEYGLSEEDIAGGGIWVLKDQVIYPVEGTYLEELDKYSTLKIENGTVMINRSNYAANDNGLAITVYDRFLNKTLAYKQF